MKHLDALMMVFVLMIIAAGFSTLSQMPSASDWRSEILSMHRVVSQAPAPMVIPMPPWVGLRLARK